MDRVNNEQQQSMVSGQTPTPWSPQAAQASARTTSRFEKIQTPWSTGNETTPSVASSTVPTPPTTTSGQQLQMSAQSPQSDDVNTIRQRIFNGTDCGGMSTEFADKIAYTESRGGCCDNINDYGCVNTTGSAFGRYQMQVPALIDAGYMDKNREFVPETGIKNMHDFLNNPSAQEQAMCNYLDRINPYNKNWNNYKYLGKNIQVGDLNIPITKDMMLAGTHREGARKLNEWLNDAKFQNNNLVRDPIYDQQDKRRKNITNRFKEIINPPK